MQNKKLGTAFEREMVEYLSSQGFWTHFITPDKRGSQPFDIIAVKDNIAYAYECKTLTDKKRWFTIDRLEYNQIYAFKKWMECHNSHCYVSVKWKDHIYILPYCNLAVHQKIDMSKEVPVL